MDSTQPPQMENFVPSTAGRDVRVDADVPVPEIRAGAFLLGSAAGVIAVTLAGAGFLLLLTLVAAEWAPLAEADAALLQAVNGFVSQHPFLVRVLRLLTAFGGSQAAWVLFPAAVVYLLVRRLPRLAALVAVAGAGAGILIVISKALVDRARPEVGTAYDHVTDASFPSGHTLTSTVTYGILLMVLAPTAAPARRKVWTTLVVLVVVAVGLTRVGLGVHYPSDVVGGWALGLLWLAAVTAAFTQATPARATAPWKGGVEPEDEQRLEPAPAEAHVLPHRWVTVGQLCAAWVLILGAVTGLGLWITGTPAVVLLDQRVVEWFVGVRSEPLTTVFTALSRVGATSTVIAVVLAAAPVAVAITRCWTPAVFLAIALAGEAALYAASAALVSRTRPAVDRISHGLPDGASYPSGHVAATVVVLGALALLVRARWGGWAGHLSVAVAVLLPVVVAVSRVYRGVHHPTDVLASLLLGAAWLAACWWALQPLNREEHEDSTDSRSRRDGGTPP